MKPLKKKTVVIFMLSLFLCALYAAPGGGPSGGAPSSPQGGQPSPQPQSGEPPAPGGGSPRGAAPLQEQKPPEPPEGDRPAPQMMYYRGQRVASVEDEFFLQQVSASRSGKKTLTVEISFNQNINPRSVKSGSILVDGEALPQKARLSFNRRGDTIRLSVPSESDQVLLRIQGITSYDGTELSPVEVLASSQK